MKISVIIPVYNVKNYIKECLDSLIKQTFQDFEILCVDDGSDDGTAEILNNYKNNYDNIQIIHNPHTGAAEARNTGVRHANGKYVMFLDSDDYFEPDFLNEMVSRAENYDADLVVCSSRKVDETGIITESSNPLFPINIDKVPLETPFNCYDYPDNIFDLFSVVPWNKLYLKKMIVDNNLKFQNISSSNDVGFGENVKICAKKIIVFNRELINYRYKRAGSIAEFRAKKTINIVHAAIFVKDYLKTIGLFDKFKNAYINVFVNHIRSGISLCSYDEYIEFLNECKALIPDDWKIFQNAFTDRQITLKDLETIAENKKVVLWGASKFLEKILQNNNEINPNILGIIDRNTALQGKIFCGYKVFAPEQLEEISPQFVLLTVINHNEEIYSDLKNLLKNYDGIKLLPNIFNRQ